MSYAERDFATVPAAAPAWKNQRTTSCPAPISAKVPYFASSRLILRAFRFVVNSSVDSIGFSGKARILLYQERNHQLSSRNNSETSTPVQKIVRSRRLRTFHGSGEMPYSPELGPGLGSSTASTTPTREAVSGLGAAPSGPIVRSPAK